MKKTILMISVSAIATLHILGMHDKIHKKLSWPSGKNEKQKNVNRKIKFEGSCPFSDCFYLVNSNIKEEVRSSMISHLKAKHKNDWCPRFGCIENREVNISIEEHIIDHNLCITEHT